MSHYRLYLLDKDGHFVRAVDLDCQDDEEALERVAAHKHRHGMELWQGSRQVGSIPAPER